MLSGDGDGPPRPVAWQTRLTESAGAASDSIDGGPGRDQLTFRGRAADVTVDLAAGSAVGDRGERDRVVAIEDVAGGEGDDLLTGDVRDNVLEGGSGDDGIDGRAGNDYVLGNLVPSPDQFSDGYTPPDPGADTLRGGAGNDTLDAGNERGDVLSGGAGDDILEDKLSIGGTHARNVRCGSGRDTIAFAPRGQLLSHCELLRRVHVDARIALRPQRRARGQLRLAWTCLQDDGCAIALSVRVCSSRPASRVVSTRGPARRAFLVRTRRVPRRGDVVDITIIVADDPRRYAARWGVTLP